MRSHLQLMAGFAALGVLSTSSVQAQIYTRQNANGVVEATNVPGSALDGYRLTYVGKGTLIHSRGFQGSYSGEFNPDIAAAAALHQLNPNLIKAVIRAESAFDQWAVSSKGAQGLMQLMPPTARRFGVSDPFNARQNIFAGAQYLRILLDMFGGNVSLALAGYNAGENAVRRHGGIPPYRETRNYVRKIQRFLGAAAAATAPPPDSANFFVPSARLKLTRSAQARPNGPHGQGASIRHALASTIAGGTSRGSPTSPRSPRARARCTRRFEPWTEHARDHPPRPVRSRAFPDSLQQGAGALRGETARGGREAARGGLPPAAP